MVGDDVVEDVRLTVAELCCSQSSVYRLVARALCDADQPVLYSAAFTSMFGFRCRCGHFNATPSQIICIG